MPSGYDKDEHKLALDDFCTAVGSDTADPDYSAISALSRLNHNVWVNREDANLISEFYNDQSAVFGIQAREWDGAAEFYGGERAWEERKEVVKKKAVGEELLALKEKYGGW